MPSVREPDAEPIPGYRLVEFLGQGGFGEVWKCEAPGGVFKAIKFLHGNLNSLDVARLQAEKEWKALQLVKAVRHPFLLGLDRLEVVGGELVVVMELADRSLAARFRECREAGQPGIPRAELLAYLREAAEALDVINLQHHLQHLDVKPANLFLVNHHVKVGDFGLLNCLGDGADPALGGLTPLYCAPETLTGKVSGQSDQYSLAVVYQELLTGRLPYAGRNARELMLRRATGDPDLTPLPPAERAVVGRALARDPDQRYPSCTEFVRALAPELMPANSSPFLDVLISDGAARSGARGGRSGTRAALTRAALTRETLAVPRDGAAGHPAPAPPPAAALPAFAGHGLLKCLEQGPLCETWRVLAPDGQARWLKLPVGLTDGNDAAEAEVIRFLTGRAHPGLLPVGVIRNDVGRVGLVCDPKEGTLAERLRHCRRVGQPGIPRRELLDYLAAVADLLDTLYRDHRLQHLCLGPNALVLDGKDAFVADMGLGQLLWLPAGQPLGRLNGRYAAPELSAGEPSPACDQYSLAVIFQEMLTGAAPFRGGPARGKTQPNLDPLPRADRGAIARTLRADPGRRFATCGELVAALDRGTVVPDSRPVSLVLPPVVPLPGPGSAHDVSPAEPIALVRQMVERASSGFQVCHGDGLRYLLDPGKLLKHSCGARLPAGLAHLKAEAFRQEWNADLVSQEAGAFVLDVPLPAGLWHRCLGRRPALRVHVNVTPPRVMSEALAGVHVDIWPLDCRPTEAATALAQMGPEILQSLRTHLHAEHERQAQERIPFEHALGVFSALDGGPSGDALVCRGKDLSLGGIGFFAPEDPRTDHLYVQSLLTPELSGLALLGQVVRVQRRAPDLVKVGLAFVKGAEPLECLRAARHPAR
jgi:serine/threonine protein kinase